MADFEKDPVAILLTAVSTVLLLGSGSTLAVPVTEVPTKLVTELVIKRVTPSELASVIGIQSGIIFCATHHWLPAASGFTGSTKVIAAGFRP